jgi:hypothetical protein
MAKKHYINSSTYGHQVAVHEFYALHIRLRPTFGAEQGGIFSKDGLIVVYHGCVDADDRPALELYTAELNSCVWDYTFQRV